MKFLCIQCDEVMKLTDYPRPEAPTMSALFECARCDFKVVLFANPMETQLVRSLDYGVGGRTVPTQPLGFIQSNLAAGRSDAFKEPRDPPEAVGQSGGRVEWSLEARDRLGKVPSFARGMVKRIYTDYARERAITVITPTILDQVRTDLGMEDM